MVGRSSSCPALSKKALPEKLSLAKLSSICYAHPYHIFFLSGNLFIEILKFSSTFLSREALCCCVAVPLPPTPCIAASRSHQRPNPNMSLIESYTKCVDCFCCCPAPTHRVLWKSDTFSGFSAGGWKRSVALILAPDRWKSWQMPRIAHGKFDQ